MPGFTVTTMSYGTARRSAWRKASLTSRRARFRPTEPPIFVDAEIPRRPSPRAETRQTFRRELVPRYPVRRIVAKSALFLSRLLVPNFPPCGGLGPRSEATGSSGPEALPAFGTPSLDHESSAARAHAYEEAVSLSPATIVRLERSLHCLMESLRKVELVILSVNRRIVKRRSLFRPFCGGLHAMVRSFAERTFLPTESFFAGSLVDLGDTPFLSMLSRFLAS